MGFSELIKSRRSIRRFRQQTIDKRVLLDFIETARCAPSAANRQPLSYIIVASEDVREHIFEQLAWAGYVTPKRNPPAGNHPVAYIVVLADHSITAAETASVDAGAAIQNILLAAWAKRIGTCWLGAINRENLRQILSIPDHLYIDSVIALGYPAETPITEDAKDGNIKYYLDQADTLHVPKRKLSDIAYMNKFGKKL